MIGWCMRDWFMSNLRLRPTDDFSSSELGSGIKSFSSLNYTT